MSVTCPDILILVCCAYGTGGRMESLLVLILLIANPGWYLWFGKRQDKQEKHLSKILEDQTGGIRGWTVVAWTSKTNQPVKIKKIWKCRGLEMELHQKVWLRFVKAIPQTRTTVWRNDELDRQVKRKNRKILGRLIVSPVEDSFARDVAPLTRFSLEPKREGFLERITAGNDHQKTSRYPCQYEREYATVAFVEPSGVRHRSYPDKAIRETTSTYQLTLSFHWQINYHA